MNTELIRKARAFIADRIPNNQLNLDRWVQGDTNNDLKHEDVKPQCGSIACIGGWLATSGLIENMQLTRLPATFGATMLVPWNPRLDTEPELEADDYYWHSAIGLFAEAMEISSEQSDALFAMAGDGSWDADLDPDGRLEHKALALARFDHLLALGAEA